MIGISTTGTSAFRLAPVAADDPVVQIGNTLGLHRNDERVFQLLRPRCVVTFGADVVVDVEDRTVQRTAAIVVLRMEAIFPFPGVTPQILLDARPVLPVRRSAVVTRPDTASR